MRAPRFLIGLASGILFLSCAQTAVGDTTIGLALPLSGPYADAGREARQQAEAAVLDLNARGGLLGQRLRLDVEDDGCESAMAAGAARRLLNKNPAIVIGHPCSGAAVAAANLYGTEGALFLATGARHGSLTEPRAGPTVFRLAPRDDRQGIVAAWWLFRSAPFRRIVLVHDGSRYALDVLSQAREDLRARGAAGVVTARIVSGREDYPRLTERLRDLKSEAVFFAGHSMEAVIVLRGLRRAGIGIPFLGSDSIASDIFGKEAGRDRGTVRALVPARYGTRTVSHSPEDGTARHAGGQAWLRGLGTLMRGAIEAWAKCVQDTGTFNGGAVALRLGAAPVKTTALGPVKFDENGDLQVPSHAVATWDGFSWTSGE
jgi:branched-chain amino acid transport system substrate-binding protein